MKTVNKASYEKRRGKSSFFDQGIGRMDEGGRPRYNRGFIR
jgi:hypothetical protein